MTEMTQGSSQGLDSSAQAVSSPVASMPAQDAQAPSSKSFTQQEVDRIVGSAKRDAVDTYRRLQVEQPEYWSKKYGDQVQSQAQGQSHTTPSQGQSQTPYSIDDVKRTAAEEVQRQMENLRTDEKRKSQEAENQRIVADFFTKLNTGKEKHPDFEKKLSALDLSKMANTVYLSRNLDNNGVADVFAHFADNPMKALHIEQMTYFNPALANSELQKLANSLKEQEEASKITLPKPPLSQTKPGNSGLGSGEWTTAAAKIKYRG